MNSGIELRDRPARSSPGGLYQRARPSSAAASAAAAASASEAEAQPPLHARYLPPPSRPYAAAAPDTLFIMKPLVGAMQAWSCVVISLFAIVILSILGLLFRSNHHEMVGGVEDPENGPAVAATIFAAVLVYVGFLVFCGLQGLLHLRENRRGAIALS